MGILDLVFPKTCLGCERGGKYICQGCLAKVRYAKPICPYCERDSVDGLTHTKCVKEYGLDGLVSVWKYEGVIRKAILSLKYRYATEIGKELVDHLTVSLKSRALPFTTCFLPIPIHWYRENVRGFNQSVEIGKVVAGALNLKFESGMLIRKRLTTPQVELLGQARRQNLRGVFALNPNFVPNPAHSVLLFDDVFTTGSTLKEATKVLKRAGIQKVWGLTIAR